tara:strand:- start:568 stop:1020 length:453 start_codon:yes stop_codon:yes gene_type:complete
MIRKVFTIAFIFLLANCGYQPLYSNKVSNKFTFKEVELLGDKNINRKIISTLSIKENDQQFYYEKIILKSNQSIVETSRDSKGTPDSFKMILRLSISIKNNGIIIKETSISKDFSYKNLDNKFDLSEYEINVKKNLTERIIEELIIYLNI